MNQKEKINHLTKSLEKIYKSKKEKLLFHGWHHIIFVRNKALEFAKSINANLFIVEAAALVHDLNYLVKLNSEPQEGKEFRKTILSKSEFTLEEINRIEEIIMEAHTAIRTANISKEGKSLSDADTLFKALPITPILFTGKYVEENKINIFKLADKITTEQNKLFNEDIYFYTKLAKIKYLKWAKTNLELWNNVKESLNDRDVVTMLNNVE